MTKAEAWEKLRSYRDGGFVEPSYGGGFGCCLFDFGGDEVLKSHGPTPEAAIAAAFGETLEPDPPCEDTELIDALEAWTERTHDLGVAAIRREGPDVLVGTASTHYWHANADGTDLRAALRSLRDATAKGGKA